MTDSIRADNYFAVIPEWVLYADISAQALRLYGVFRRYADKDGVAWPSRATLADRLRSSTNTVDRAIKELVEIGALEVHHRKDEQGGWTSNLYYVRSMEKQDDPLPMDDES